MSNSSYNLKGYEEFFDVCETKYRELFLSKAEEYKNLLIETLNIEQKLLEMIKNKGALSQMYFNQIHILKTSPKDLFKSYLIDFLDHFELSDVFSKGYNGDESIVYNKEYYLNNPDKLFEKSIESMKGRKTYGIGKLRRLSLSRTIGCSEPNINYSKVKEIGMLPDDAFEEIQNEILQDKNVQKLMKDIEHEDRILDGFAIPAAVGTCGVVAGFIISIFSSLAGNEELLETGGLVTAFSGFGTLLSILAGRIVNNYINKNLPEKVTQIMGDRLINYIDSNESESPELN